MKFESSVALRDWLKGQSRGRIILSFSRGKDAIAAWLALREDGFEVLPYHLEGIPGMSFVRDSLTYFEDFFHTKIKVLPHPSLYRKLDNLVFQPPEHRLVIDRVLRRELLYEHIYAHMRTVSGYESAYVATGVRAADSPVRRMAMETHGPVGEKDRTAAVVYDWKIKEVREAIAASGVQLPVDYELFGRTFDGIDFRFIEPLRERFPDDYQKVLDWFPLADLDSKRREWFGGIDGLRDSALRFGKFSAKERKILGGGNPP